MKFSVVFNYLETVIRILENKMSFGKGMVAPELAFLLVWEILVTEQNENSSLSV